jgi:hypothetical protein
MGRSDDEWRAFRAKTAARRAPPPSLPLPPPIDRKAIVLGRNTESSVPIVLSERARLEHAHVIGTTGGGKTKFLEACIRQDIRAGRGVCVVDPHGDHPDTLLRRRGMRSYQIKPTIIWVIPSSTGDPRLRGALRSAG